MPLPSPKPKETEDEFISRCMHVLANSDSERPQKQRVAICYSQWRKKKEAPPFDLPPQTKPLKKEFDVFAEEVKSAWNKMENDVWYKQPGQRVEPEKKCPENEVEQEMTEHPWATREMAEKIVEDHKKRKE